MVKFTGKNKKSVLDDITSINVFKRNAGNKDSYEAKYRELFDHMQNCVAVYMAVDNGEDFIIADFNRSAELTEKIKKRDIVGERVSWVFPSVKDIGLFEVFQRVFRTGISEHHTTSFYKDERISGWRENYVYKIPTGEVVAIYDDVTSRVHAQEELNLAKERLQFAQKSAGAGMWDWDMNTGKLTWSKELYNLFGLDPEKDTSTFDVWRKALYPEDRQTSEEKINESIKEHKPLYNEYRIILPSGEVRWINAYGDTIYDKHGKAVRMSGICIDGTDQKKSREALRISEGKVTLNVEKLQKTLDNTINALSSIVELKDPYTSGHQIGVKKLSITIAEEMGLGSDKINAISIAAIVHDLGKIMIPASILSKPSTLTELEFTMIKTHSQAGNDIIKEIDFGHPVEDIVLQHHERLDGSGYPNALKANQIMLEAKIIAVADVVEAMVSHRPYRPAPGIDKALDAIKAGRDILYDSDVVDACLKVFTLGKFQF